MDVVADLAPPAGARVAPRRALDLTADPAILTAIANDIGTEAVFSRQVIAYGGAGDALLALSTSGNSRSVLAALVGGAPARPAHGRARRLRRRPGRRRRARRPRRGHSLAAHPAHPGGPGHRVPPAARARRDGRSAAGRPRAPTRVRASGCRASCRASASGRSSTASRASAARRIRAERRARRHARGRGPTGTVDSFLARLAGEAPPLARRRARRRASRSRRPASASFAIVESVRGGGRHAGRARRGDLRRVPRRAARSGRPPLPLSVRQLHELRAAVHDRARRPVRPAADDDGRVPDVLRLPGRVRRSRRPALPRPAERVPRVRAAGAVAHRDGEPLDLPGPSPTSASTTASAGAAATTRRPRGLF